MQIQPLTPADYDALVDTWKKAGLHYRPSGRDSKLAIVVQMSRDPELFLGAFEKGNLVGSTIASYDGRRGWINRLAVIPEARRRGIARQLIQHAERLLRQRGALIIAANIEKENEASLKLFKSSGYKIHDDIFYVSKRDSENV